MHIYHDVDRLAEDLIHRRLLSHARRDLILIGGCSRTGKTHLAEEMADRFENQGISCLKVSLDAWLIGKDKRPTHSTVMERYEVPAMVSSIQKVLNGESVYPPVYDPGLRQRLSQKQNEPMNLETGVVMVEGVIGLEIAELREKAMANIYTDISDANRWNRLMSFYTEIKGFKIKEAEALLQARELEEVALIKKGSKYANICFRDLEL